MHTGARALRAMSQKIPISLLPLPPSTHQLTKNLTPDPIAPNPKEFLKLLRENPSSLRRSRASDPSAHFSYVTPLPSPFPYRIPQPPPDVSMDTPEERSAYVQKYLTSQEPLIEASLPGRDDKTQPLKRYHSENREELERELLSLAPTCLEDCLPHLDAGDAFQIIGTKEGLSSSHENGSQSASDEAQSARRDLIDVLSGDIALMELPTPNDGPEVEGYSPWSLRYSGHQFGSWAGQLGDGRAISILETAHPDDQDVTFELQLKGAGRTPFSRGADGLAVLRSSVREYLAAEAMHALRIPTTRSLALISLPNLPVARERTETAAIVTRVAESFIRIGSFQALNPPPRESQFVFFGGGGSQAQQDPDYEALRKLGEWVSRCVLKLELKEGEAWGKKLVWECARRNAVMVAGWQQMGFMHGVMNTDNISIMGLTMDYGPYAFMDVFSDHHICNHTDEGGRYAYKYQPTMIIYALRMLLQSLAPLIGAEREAGNKAVQLGWADQVSKEDLESWAEDGMELKNELEEYIKEVFSGAYWKLMRERLSLKTVQPNDSKEIIRPLLDLMEKHAMDFHSTFRLLLTFHPAILEDRPKDQKLENDLLEQFMNRLLPTDRGITGISAEVAAKELLSYLEVYAARLALPEEVKAWEQEAKDGEDWLAARERAGKRHNPRFVLRQWVLEEVIDLLQKDAKRGEGASRTSGEEPSPGKQLLNKILQMSTQPFDAWGAEGSSKSEEELTDEQKLERRLCGLGEKRMLGFQCSCSS